MPELPEVEVIKLFLENKLIGLTVSQIDILTPKSFIGNPKYVIGQKILRFSRLGKQLSLHLSSNLIILIHLKMTGQLIYQGFVLGHTDLSTAFSPSGNHPCCFTRIIFTFSDNSKLFFNDQRKFGWVRLVTPAQLRHLQGRLGLDVFDPRLTPDYLYLKFRSTSRPVKLVLLDQTKFAGIGNIYANDALFLAQIHPLTPARNISRPQALSLHRSLLKLMRQSILAGGSTAKDRTYLRPDGTAGQNQFNFFVYQRVGEPCPVCGVAIHRLKHSGRSSFFCPRCQKIRLPH
jgi:formamidopyrimidine-DNA glycosylase